MMTAIVEAPLREVERSLGPYLPEATVVQVGRLVAIQHPELDVLGAVAIRELAHALNLPLKAVRPMPPLAHVGTVRQLEPKPKALPPSP